MKAVGYTKSLPITNPESLVDIDLPQPIATGHDLLIKVKAIAVNPVDLIDQGYIQTTVGENLGTINAANLRKAHEALETGRSIGKLVLAGTQRWNLV